MKRTTGMVLGKFLPPTRGHQYLVDFACAYADEVTVIVGSLAREPIAGHLRFGWMREMCPRARVVHLTDENPQAPDEHPDFWRIWHASIRRLLPAGPDYVFASEDYGFKLAEVLGARYIPVDHRRMGVPVRASDVLRDPLRHWAMLPDCVRPHFVRRVCLVGAESTGKSVLAQRLAEHFETVCVDEYARGYIELHANDVRPEMFEVFLRGRGASEAALARQANRVLICDTDARTTRMYYEIMVGPAPDWLYAAEKSQAYDLYLFLENDTPYVADPQRNHAHLRDAFRDACRAELDRTGANYRVIGGNWEERFARARDTVRELLNVST